MIHGAGDQGIALHAIAKAFAEHRDFDLALKTVQTMTGDIDKARPWLISQRCSSAPTTPRSDRP